MPKAYSQDLRERVIDAVKQHGMSCRACVGADNEVERVACPPPIPPRSSRY
jgi:hypothetical protein